VTAGAAAPGEPRFLCDEMLGRLARYLRAAGYDTTLAADGAADRDLVAAARDEQRTLLTCDRRIAEHKAAAGVATILPRGDLDALARELAARCGVDWLHRPFSRCLVDNAPLVVAAATHRVRVPADVAALPALACPDCDRVYWAGSHHRRMRARLERWHAGRFERDRSA
jgi:uncharacterized protein